MNKAKSFKQQAHELIDRLPDTATWPDLIDYAAEKQDQEIAQFYSEYEAGHMAAENEVAERAAPEYDSSLQYPGLDKETSSDP